MTECLAEADVRQLAQATLSEFDKHVSGLSPELSVPFNHAAVRLEAELLTIYRFVVQIVRKEDDLERIAGWWGTMVTQCDEFANRLQAVSLTHPGSGADQFYNRVLDLRNKCQRLREMHS